MRSIFRFTVLILLCSGSAFAGVTITAPADWSSVGTNVQFAASATSDAGHPISSMMIYIDDHSAYLVYSNSLNKVLSVGLGSHTAAVKSWDSAGNLYTQTVHFTAIQSSPSSGGSTISNIQQMSGWGSCSACAGAGGNGPIALFSMTPHISSPSLTGNSTRFWIGGTHPYSDALWWKNLSSGSSAQHFIFNLYFYMKNPSAAESLEFDVNLAYNHRYYLFSTQCSPRASHTWDTFNAITGHWNSTGVGCPTFPAYRWNHVVIALERTWDSRLHWISIAMNGVTHYVNRYAYSRSTSYSNGLGVDFQMDGDYNQQNYSVWLDKVNLSYY